MKTKPHRTELNQRIHDALAAQPVDFDLVILFGSLAADEGDADSDIDLAVQAGHALTAPEKMALIASLGEATGRAVDLVDLKTVGEPLLGQILRYGKRLLGDDGAYARLLYRHLVDQADFLPYRDRILAARRQTWIGQ